MFGPQRVTASDLSYALGVDTWTIRHISLANPIGPRVESVPALLRRVADTVEGLGDVEVQDIVFHQELVEDGWQPSMTVYFSTPDDA